MKKLRFRRKSFWEDSDRGEICHCQHCQRQCKIFATGVNFSRNNTFSRIISRKGWLAIAKLKSLSLFMSLLLMLKKAFDNVKIGIEK